MRRGPRLLMPLYAAGVGVVVAAFAWVSLEVLALEAGQARAQAEARHQESVRLALWRMDSWLAPILAREAARPPADYSEETAARSPLLAFRSELFPLHFQVHPGAAVTSPQTRVPEPAQALANCTVLSQVEALVGYEVLHAEVARAEERMAGSFEAAVTPVESPDAALAQNVEDLNFRSRATGASKQARQAAFATNALVYEQQTKSVGPLVPVWVPGDEPTLVFARRVQTVNGEVLQGLLADWDRLGGALMAEIGETLPGATLRPLPVDSAREDPSRLLLATVPVELLAPRAPSVRAGVTPTKIALAVAWAALLSAFLTTGLALRRTSDLAERRSRFASSVTHELRTPLTTFRLYSEMLADGMVVDPAQRQVYLDTLKTESARLAMLVENVLAYARLEEGRMPVRRERMRVADLLLRVQPPLDRRARECGMALSVEAGDAAGTVVDVDPAIVGQILFNVVDNACKYASGADDRRVEIRAMVRDARVAIDVLDHGPGLPQGHERAAFTPFERAGRAPGDTIPGIGLGLALSRGLARDRGGDLGVAPPPAGAGACFTLLLPVV